MIDGKAWGRLETGLAALVLVPMIAIGLLSAWLLEAERAALAADREAHARRIAAAAAAATAKALDDTARGRQAAALQAHFADGAAGPRNLVLTDPLVLLAVLTDPDGRRVFPEEDAMPLGDERTLTGRYRTALASARARLDSSAGIVWSGSALEAGGGVVACGRAERDVCLVLDADRLRALAEARIEGLLLGAPVRLFLAQSGSGAEAPTAFEVALAPPLAGWRIAAAGLPAPPVSWASLVMLLAPIAIAVAALAGLVYWTQAQRAAQDRRRIEMLAQVSHELRTPLANLRLYGSLIEGRGAGDPEVARYCAVIEAETERLAALIDNALICARDGRAAPSARTRFDPDETVRAIVTRFAPVLETLGPVELALAVGGLVAADRAAFERVLVNLLDNACKHAPGARLCVATGIDIGDLVLRVADDGPGLPRALRGGLFAAFASGDPAGGFGLGLAACRALAGAAGGTIRHEDAGAGAAFVLRLPLGETAAQGRRGLRAAEVARCAS